MPVTHLQVHPAFLVIEQTERAWARSEEQTSIRAGIVMRALFDAGFFPDAEMSRGLVVKRKDGGQR